MPNREYKNLIFTAHALERMQLRKIQEEAIYQTIHKPDEKIIETAGNMRYVRAYQGRKYHVVSGYLDREKKYLIISAWVKGEKDPSGFWKILRDWLSGLFGKGR
ncbi:hypothetical protein MASR2M15_09050 [Anaerolineales bacterium]